ncbi:LOB domain-containing protein 22-like [Herrania umbratica]|uniref:LOB domain-containing protein 22-like n=1 Tax=Herrania umbratica TaxID=108875 RepID=A0A6J0ZN69_9ROSI|nr:LOB domain-containing protein 22-like [Herrania umbratica]
MNGEGRGGNSPACAACRHHRRRCHQSCELAPYFPASKYHEFKNALKHFGLSNIVKIMSMVRPDQRQAAAESILMEGNARLDHPAHGCLGIIRNLHRLLEIYESELAAVNQQLAVFKASLSSTPQPSQPEIDHLVAKIFNEGDNPLWVNLEADAIINSVPSDSKGKQPVKPDEEAKDNEADDIFMESD